MGYSGNCMGILGLLPSAASLVLQLFAKTLATALVEKNNLRDHEK